MRRIYFDHNATTPLRPEVKAAVCEAMELFGNPSSQHSYGQEIKSKLGEARATVARCLGADVKEIVFTGSGSEGNNMTIQGIAASPFMAQRLRNHRSPHLITTTIEHPAVLQTCNHLELLGYEVTRLEVDSMGIVDPDQVRAAVKPNTVLISVMYANNEVGAIQPIKEIGAIARELGVPFHTDAVQAFGKLPIDVTQQNIDFLSLSGHKLNAPKGVGALYVRKGAGLPPLIYGGHQEFGFRAGTENTLGILALAKAAELAHEGMVAETANIARLRDRLHQGLLERLDEIALNGHPVKRLPGTLNLSFRYIEGESVVFKLDQLGIAVSTGSACNAGSEEISHVLKAMKASVTSARGSVRLSLGYGNSDDDVDYALAVIPPAIQELRSQSPLYPGRLS